MFAQISGTYCYLQSCTSPPPCRRYGFDGSLSVSFKLRLLVCRVALCSISLPSEKNRHCRFGFTVKFGFTQENGFNRIIDDWIMITWHSEVRRHASLSRLTNWVFFNVTVGSAGCTFARLGMSRSVGFNRAANDLTALACYKSQFSLCKEHAHYWCITEENLGSNGTACGM